MRQMLQVLVLIEKFLSTILLNFKTNECKSEMLRCERNCINVLIFLDGWVYIRIRSVRGIDK